MTASLTISALVYAGALFGAWRQGRWEGLFAVAIVAVAVTGLFFWLGLRG